MEIGYFAIGIGAWTEPATLRELMSAAAVELTGSTRRSPSVAS